MFSYVFPGNINDDIAKLGAEPIPYMRTDEFSAINLESEKILLDLIHCKDGKTIIYTGSGTGAMAATVENYVITKKKAIVINGGSFGKRWVSLCKYYNVPAVDFQVTPGKDIDYKLLEKTIETERPDVFLCQHHETSTGVLYQLDKISEICRKHDISLVVDVISSFLAEDLNMDELGIDICITSTQKGLNVPPGLTVVFLSAKLNGYKFAHNGYYWDFEENLDNLRRGQTPFSPATTIYLQLHARLKELEAQGGEHQNIQEVRHRAEVFREECRKYGWPMPAEHPSYAITAIQTRDTEKRKVFRGLIDKYDTYIMPGSVPGFYRISHMGLQSDDELRNLAKHIHELESEEQ